jgi:beta-lactamase regulating signal transducer with metallopeptidase domain
MISLLIESSARSLALGLIVWAALLIMRARNPHLLKTVWRVVLAASLAMPLLVRVVPTLPGGASASMYVLALAPRANATAPFQPTGWTIAATVYLLIAALLAWRLLSALLRMRRIRRDAIRLEGREGSLASARWPATLDVRSTSRLSAPATFASTILLPSSFSGWNSRKLAAVLAHESSHVRDRDCHVLWLARAYCCLYWLNPFAWWLLRRLDTLAEDTSDDAALEVLADRCAYAQILLDFAREGSAAAVAMASARISRRIDRILSGIAPARRSTVRHRAAAAVLLIPALAAAAMPVTTSSRPTDEPRIVSWPDTTALLSHYPPTARRKGVDGLVTVAVTLDPKGHARGVRILAENPSGLGFGAAASSLAYLFQYRNPTARRAQIVFNVKFALSKRGANLPPHHAQAIGG